MMENSDDSVFKLFKPDDNDKISEISGLDLQDLIILICDYNLKLRDRLGLERKVTFGLELEFENADVKKIKENLKENFPLGKWNLGVDGTLDFGGEVTSPILRDTLKTWDDVDKVCNIIRPFASIGSHSGGHIHIGTQVLGSNKEAWLNFIKMWSVYENIIYRFCYGEFSTARSSITKYAIPVAYEFWDIYEKYKDIDYSIFSIFSDINLMREQAINFKNVKIESCDIYNKDNTLEFRCPNGSLNPITWQNNVNLFVKMIMYSKSTSFNDDIISKRRELNKDNYSNLKWYSEIFLQQALELCDMVFNNNMDKIYFLSQYIKKLQTNDDNLNSVKLVKTKNK